MARASAHQADLSYNSVAIEDELNDSRMVIDIDLPQVTAFGDGSHSFVEGKYRWEMAGDGSADVAASQGDATIFGQIGSGAATIIWTPGGGAEGANNPDYTGSAFVRRYELHGAVDSAMEYSVEWQGTAALTRDVS